MTEVAIKDFETRVDDVEACFNERISELIDYYDKKFQSVNDDFRHWSDVYADRDETEDNLLTLEKELEESGTRVEELLNRVNQLESDLSDVILTSGGE